MRKLFSILTVVCILFITIFPASANGDAVDPSIKVHDGAGLLSASEVEKLEQKANTIGETYTIDIAIVTVNSTGGKSAEAYADDIYDYSGFGRGPGDDGLLLLIDMGDRAYHITTYGKAVQIFTDRDLDRIIDKFLPALSNGSYYSAFSTFLSESESHMEKAARAGTAGVTSTASRWSKAPAVLGQSVLIGIVVSGIVMLVLFLMHKRSFASAPDASNYLAGDGFRVTHSVDQFMHTHTSRTAIPKNTSSGGGGSSTHRSSSGRSHGGRGGRF